MNAIEIKDLCKSYGSFGIDHLSMTLPGGCILGLIGENGAGKSTTIKCILDIVHKDSGTITLLGRDNPKEIKAAKEEIGVVLDEAGFSGCFNALDIGRIMSLTFKNWDSAQYSAYLEKLQIPKKKKFSEFSRGMKMKLSIIVALSHHAKLLILDEATNGLDPVVRDEITDLFLEFTRDEEHSILISSHIVSDLEKICDYIAFIHDGRLLLYEEKDRLREEYAIIHCTAEQLGELDASAVIGERVSDYSAQALVKRSKIPQGFSMSPVSIEELFVFMVKGDKN